MSKINKLVIVGCAGVGGPAAMMAKKIDPSLDVTLIREEENFFSRCATPYISIERATVEASVKDDGMFHAVGTKLVNVKATSIDRKEKTVTTADGEFYPYDKLILATGGRAIVPPIPGVDLKGIFTVRTSRDAVNIHNWVNDKKAKNAVVYGAGAIGLEMASVLSQKGLKVTMVVRSYIGRTVSLDLDMSSELEKHYKDKGVVVRSREVIKKIEFPKLLNCFATKLFDKSVASVGVTEAIAREEGFDIFVIMQAAKSKYVMMEGGKPYTVKLIFDRDTKRVIGAQIIADDERSIRYRDVIALAIRDGWTALDLTTLRCAGQPELSPEPSAEPITVAAEGAFKELYPLA